MQIQVPHFKYHSKDPAQRHFGFIDLEGDVICWIDDLEDFYQAFGYSSEMRKWGVLPDEFMWEEYFSGSEEESAACFQVHLIEYLFKHSASFRKEYEHMYEHWIAALNVEISSCGKECSTCSDTRGEKYTSGAHSRRHN